jgi:hypothetical protein
MENTKNEQQCAIHDVICRCPLCKSDNIKTDVIIENRKIFDNRHQNGSYTTEFLNNRKVCNDCGVNFNNGI